jgi:class 3 adenylate cyclase
VVSSPLNPRRAEMQPIIAPSTGTATASGWSGKRLLSRFSSRMGSGTGSAKSTAGSGPSSRGGLGSEVRSEISIIARLRHPNISFLIAASASKGFVYLLMDHYKYGSLFQLLRNPEMDLPPSVRLRLALDTARGLMFLHSQDPPVLHMDLKTPNILVSAQMTAAITDFGLSSITSKRVQLGTLPWAAPEVLANAPYTSAADIYSLGVVLWELSQMSAQSPWQGRTPAAIREAVLLQQRPAIDRDLCPLGIVYADLVKRCWAHDRQDRPTAKEVLNTLTGIAEPGNAGTLDARWSADARRTVLAIRGLPESMRHDASAGVTIRPHDVPDCSLIFTDIVGFTKWSSERTAGEVAETLHRLHNVAFGKLVEECHAHHLETIGDAYIASVNFPVKLKTSHHAVAVRLGLAMAAACAPLGIAIRVGIASGPATASVVGTTNPKLTLLGDTVNLAARLESKCPAGAVLVSKVTRDALANDPAFSFSTGEEIELKGKGFVLCFQASGYSRDIDSNPDIVSEASFASSIGGGVRSPGALRSMMASHSFSGPILSAKLKRKMSSPGLLV